MRCILCSMRCALPTSGGASAGSNEVSAGVRSVAFPMWTAAPARPGSGRWVVSIMASPSSMFHLHCAPVCLIVHARTTPAGVPDVHLVGATDKTEPCSEWPPPLHARSFGREYDPVAEFGQCHFGSFRRHGPTASARRIRRSTGCGRKQHASPTMSVLNGHSVSYLPVCA